MKRMFLRFTMTNDDNGAYDRNYADNDKSQH